MRITKICAVRSGQIITGALESFFRKQNYFSISHFFTALKTTFDLTRSSCFCFYLQYDNVEACLKILRQHSVPGVDGITTNDIISGRLKAVLSLFFSLSRYKQASKLKAPVSKLQAAQSHHSSNDMLLAKER